MNIGLRVCGTYDEQDQFRMEYYFPYFAGSGITSQEDVMVEQRSEKVCFSGVSLRLREDFPNVSGKACNIENFML